MPARGWLRSAFNCGGAVVAEPDYFIARAAAGRAAVTIAHEKGAEASADMIRGAWAGFLLASAELDGWDAVMRHVQELASAARVPACIQKPKLSVVQGGKVA